MDLSESLGREVPPEEPADACFDGEDGLVGQGLQSNMQGTPRCWYKHIYLRTVHMASKRTPVLTASMHPSCTPLTPPLTLMSIILLSSRVSWFTCTPLCKGNRFSITAGGSLIPQPHSSSTLCLMVYTRIMQDMLTNQVAVFDEGSGPYCLVNVQWPTPVTERSYSYWAELGGHCCKSNQKLHCLILPLKWFLVSNQYHLPNATNFKSQCYWLGQVTGRIEFCELFVTL